MNRFRWGWVLLFMLILIPMPALASDSPSVYLDGQELFFDVPPVVVDGRLLVPLGGIFKAMNLEVHWKEPNTVFCGSTGEILWMEIGSYTCWMRQKQVDLDVPAQIIDGRAMVPLKIVAEAAACKVAYDGDRNMVTITKGEHQLGWYCLAQGYDARADHLYTQLYHSGYETRLNINSPQTVVYSHFTGQLDDNVAFAWYFDSNAGRELVYEQTVEPQYSNGESVATSYLSRDKYKVGKWIIETKINEQVIQEDHFSIVDDPLQYGTLEWNQGKYTGYLVEGQPCGYGQLLLDDGTRVEGEFFFSKIVHGMLVSDLSDFTQYTKYEDYITGACIIGRWKYPDGQEFFGVSDVRAVAQTGADLQAGNYTLYYYANGDLTTNQGDTKLINGYYKDFDPTYRFESINSGSIMEAIRLGLI